MQLRRREERATQPEPAVALGRKCTALIAFSRLAVRQPSREAPMATLQSGMMADTAVDDAVFRKVFRRLIWFLFILLVVSFMDRINIAFAALTMNKELGLSAAAYGMSFTVFYVTYALFEVPSNLILARVGARLWIARIMVTWGLTSAAT